MQTRRSPHARRRKQLDRPVGFTQAGLNIHGFGGQTLRCARVRDLQRP
jgi:hypothetical protein